MKHEKLLEKINIFDNTCSTDGRDKGYAREYGHRCANLHELAQALRIVVELHKPSKGSDDLPPCLQCGRMYPCPTIENINKELS